MNDSDYIKPSERIYHVSGRPDIAGKLADSHAVADNIAHELAYFVRNDWCSACENHGYSCVCEDRKSLLARYNKVMGE